MAILLALGQPVAAQWTATLFALATAAFRLVTMHRQLALGRWGIDLLAILAIVSTAAVREYVASLIIVLMLPGGMALEDFAEARATKELTALLNRAPPSGPSRTVQWSRGRRIGYFHDAGRTAPGQAFRSSSC